MFFCSCIAFTQGKNNPLFNAAVGYVRLGNNQYGYELNNRLNLPLGNKTSIAITIGLQTTFNHDTTMVPLLQYDKPFTKERRYFADWFITPSVSYEPVKNFIFEAGAMLKNIYRTHSRTKNLYYYNSDGSLRKVVPLERTDYLFDLKLGLSVGVAYKMKISESLIIEPRINYQSYTKNDYNSLSVSLGFTPNIKKTIKERTRNKTLMRNDFRIGLAFTNTDFKLLGANYYQNQYTRLLNLNFNFAASLGVFNTKDKEKSIYSSEFPVFKTIATGFINNENIEYKFARFKQSRIKAAAGVSFIYYKDIWRTVVTDQVYDFNNEPNWATTDDGLYYERSDYEKSLSIGYNAYLEYEVNFSPRVLAALRIQRQSFSDYSAVNSAGVSVGYRF